MNEPAVVGVVRPARRPNVPACSPAIIITRLGSAEIATWEQLEMAVASRPEREVEMVVIRDGREERLTITPDTTELRTRTDARFEVGTIGVLPDVNPSIRAIVAGEPAEKAGFKAGDVIVSINGQRMVFASQVSEAIAKHPERGHPAGRAARRRASRRSR